MGETTTFVRTNTELAATSFVANIRLHLATELTPLWQATEDFLNINNVSPPFWAFVWPGSAALSLHIEKNPSLVAGKHVLDFAAGSGLAAIAAARAGAITSATDIDPIARAAIKANARANNVPITVLENDVTQAPCEWDLIIAGDIFYEALMTSQILPWLRKCAQIATVIIADPGRKYAPSSGFTELAEITVPTSLALESTETRVVRLIQLNPS